MTTPSLVDVLLVARFEVLRALRTWQALALVVVYLLANVGLAYLFVELLGTIENGIADQLRVPRTRWPGPLLDRVRQSEELLRMLTSMIGDEAVVRRLVERPLLAVFQLWQGLVLVPFLAAAAAAEGLAADVRTRAVRFEALRTGRPELVAGRFLGQVVLAGVATLVSLVGVWLVGVTLMVGQDPVALALGLLALGLRALVFALPFVALGVVCSAVTSSPAWARVLALCATAGSWVAYGLLRSAVRAPWSTAADAVLPLLPQSWIDGLWRGGLPLVGSTLVCAGLALTATGLAWALLARRDL